MRFSFLPVAIFVGIVLGARSESLRRDVLSRQEGTFGSPPAVMLKVESEVTRYARKDGRRGVSFYSTLGNQPLKVSAPLNDEDEIPRKGEIWECRGWISSSGMMSSHRFSRRFFWIGSRGVFRKVADASLRDESYFYGRINGFLSRLCDVGTGWCPEIAGLNKAVLLGNRSLMSKEMRSAFCDAGTIHVFAISGLHIVLISNLLTALLGRLGFAGRMKAMLSIPLLVAFVVLSGSKPSAIRALIMTILVLAGPMFGRSSNPLSAWSITVLLIYGFKPEMLFDIGCTFSFVVMFGIVAVLHASIQIKRAVVVKGALKTASEWADGTKGRTWLLSRGMTLAVSLSAWVMSVPITSVFFGKISFGGLLANMIVISLAGCSVRLGFYALCAGLISTPLVSILNNCCALCTWGMVIVSRAVAELPFSSVEIRPWTFFECVLWYGIWFLIYKISLALILKKILGGRKWW